MGYTIAFAGLNFDLRTRTLDRCAGGNDFIRLEDPHKMIDPRWTSIIARDIFLGEFQSSEQQGIEELKDV
jgi:hypothetical protein